MHQLRRTRRLLVAVPTALLAVSLVGCGDIAEKAAEDALEDEGIKADIDGSDIKIDTTDGGVVTGELPKDFPIDEVPVVDGEILFGTYTKSSKTWDTTVEVGPAGGDKAAAYDEAEAKLLDAGATVVQETGRQRLGDRRAVHERRAHHRPRGDRHQRHHRELPRLAEAVAEPSFRLMAHGRDRA